MNRITCVSFLTRATIVGVAASITLASAGQSPPPATPPSAPKAPAAPAKPAAPAPPAAPTKDGAAAGQQFTPPPGMTEADMMACAAAATPGPMHEFLAKGVGVWSGKSTMWMMPGSEPVKSECTSTTTSMFDGRFVRVEMAGEIPGMGPFNGFGVYGYDNTAETFQSTWIDNCGTGMMVGTGQLSSDGKSLSWVFNYTCPITKKNAVMREIERVTGENTRTLEMFNTDPKSGKEYKMMEIAFTRTPSTAPAGTTSATPAGSR